MITTEQIRSLLTMEQLEQFNQGTPQGTLVGVAADVTATDESDWAHKHVVARSLAFAFTQPLRHLCSSDSTGTGKECELPHCPACRSCGRFLLTHTSSSRR